MSDLERKLREMVLPRGYTNTLLIQAADRLAELEELVRLLRIEPKSLALKNRILKILDNVGDTND